MTLRIHQGSNLCRIADRPSRDQIDVDADADTLPVANFLRSPGGAGHVDKQARIADDSLIDPFQNAIGNRIR